MRALRRNPAQSSLINNWSSDKNKCKRGKFSSILSGRFISKSALQSANCVKTAFWYAVLSFSWGFNLELSRFFDDVVWNKLKNWYPIMHVMHSTIRDDIKNIFTLRFSALGRMPGRTSWWLRAFEDYATSSQFDQVIQNLPDEYTGCVSPPKSLIASDSRKSLIKPSSVNLY